jgi:hypothetical protein
MSAFATGMAPAFGDGKLRNFTCLTFPDLYSRVKEFKCENETPEKKRTVPVLAEKLQKFHEKHPRNAVKHRAPCVPEQDKEKLMGLLERLNWPRYTNKAKKYLEKPAKGVIKKTKTTQGDSTGPKRLLRAVAVGSSNFVLGVTRGPLGGGGFEKAGPDGIGKNTTIVKSKQIRAGDKETCMALWQHMRKMVKDVDPNYSFTSIQVNKNFVGKPHRDKNDHSYQFALSVGDFTGGELVIETDDPQQLTVLETKDRLSKCDGRRTHWVTPYSGTRYSIIMYRNIGKRTPVLTNRGHDTNAQCIEPRT